MDIILLQPLDKVGEKHEVVTVKNGYARNYLIPRRLAIIANKENLGKLEELKRKEAEAQEKRMAKYKDIEILLADKVLKVGAKAGTSGKIFGSVTNVQIAQALKEQFSIEVDRHDIEMPEEVKDLGTYAAILKLHAEIQPKVNFEVIAD